MDFGCRLTDEIDLTEWVADTPDREEDGRVRLVKDWEADSIVVELVSLGKYNDVSMSFPSEDKFIGTELPLLVLQLKNLGRFTGLRVEVLATNKKTYYIESSNRQSLAKLTDDTVSIPLELTEGWNSVVIDVPMLLGRVFSVDFKVSVPLVCVLLVLDPLTLLSPHCPANQPCHRLLQLSSPPRLLLRSAVPRRRAPTATPRLPQPRQHPDVNHT